MSETQQMVTRHFDVTAREFDSIYSGEGKGRLSRLLDLTLRHDMFDRFRLTIEACGDPTGKEILDVGCGTGRFMIPLAARGARVTGLDPAPTMIDMARKLIGKENLLDRCDFVVSDLDTWATGRKFDIVLGIGLYDYLADPETALRKMLSMTRERVVLTFPRRWTWRAPIRKYRLARRGCPVFFYDRDDVRRLVAASGGEIERFEVTGKLYFVTVKQGKKAS